MNRKQIVERRKYKRFQPQNNAKTFVVLNPGYTRLGHLADISMDGLAFRYVGGEGLPGEASELEMFFLDRSFCLDEVPFETISDFKVIPSSNLKRCSVQFGELTDIQISQLKHFIRNHTLGEIGV